MLFVISPAKALDYETPLRPVQPTQPLFVPQSAQLIRVLKRKSARQVGALMNLSEALSALNVARYQAWEPGFTERNARPAVLAFDGDVYGGLDARAMSPRQLDWAQQHLCILSGLYGVLRPLDLMQPYRLEMGTRLAVGKTRNLYQFWGPRIAEYLNERLQGDPDPVLVNLASQEYFKAVDRKTLRARVVECVFEEYRAGAYKTISFMAKRARGLMARYAITRRVRAAGQLEGFDLEGYAFAAGVSQPDRLVFRRRAA